jgi:hypothetical protein
MSVGPVCQLGTDANTPTNCCPGIALVHGFPEHDPARQRLFSTIDVCLMHALSSVQEAPARAVWPQTLANTSG